MVIEVEGAGWRRTNNNITGVITAPDDPFLADWESQPIDRSNVEAVRRAARLANRGIEGQAAICAGHHESRMRA